MVSWQHILWGRTCKTSWSFLHSHWGNSKFPNACRDIISAIDHYFISKGNNFCHFTPPVIWVSQNGRWKNVLRIRFHLTFKWFLNRLRRTSMENIGWAWCVVAAEMKHRPLSLTASHCTYKMQLGNGKLQYTIEQALFFKTGGSLLILDRSCYKINRRISASKQETKELKLSFFHQKGKYCDQSKFWDHPSDNQHNLSFAASVVPNWYAFSYISAKYWTVLLMF